MKKNITLTVLLLVLAFAFSSCEKQKEWKYRYGYSIDDIVGEYTFSNIEGAFEDGLIENQDCHICPDAEISITKLTEKTVKLRINCPEAGFSREYIGTPTKNKNDFKIHMTSGYMMRVGTRFKAYNLMSSVYQNEAQNIRLHGFASFSKYKVEYPFAPDSTLVDTVLTQSINYYFDVIKN